MEIATLGPNEEIPMPDHVVVVRLGNERFEVSGTAGCEQVDASFLRPVLFSTPSDALKRAEEFAAEHSLPTIYVKGFQPLQSN
jgi:hypothetical protein